MNRNKIFFEKLFVFFLLVLAGNFLMNTVYDHWMYYNRMNRNQDRQFNAMPDTLRYLMVGNSHNIIDPEILGNSFSYVTPRELYPQTYYKLKYILEKTSKRPRYILLSIDPLNFSPKAENDLTFDGYWKKYLDYPEMMRETGHRVYLLNWVTGRFFSYVGNFKFMFNSIPYLRANFKLIKHGYFPRRNYRNFGQEQNREALGLQRATSYLASYNKTSELGTVRYYGKILDLCKKYHIRPVLLRMPLTDEYLKSAYAMVDIKKLDGEVIAYTRLHSDNFKVFDFRNKFHGKPEYFFNADHVNPIGATIVTKKIKYLLEMTDMDNYTDSLSVILN